MGRAERRWRTKKIQLRRYKLIRNRNETVGYYSWRKEWLEPMWWFDEIDYGKLRNDQDSSLVCEYKFYDRDIWINGKRVKLGRSNQYFAEELESLGFTRNFSVSLKKGRWYH